MRRTFISSMCSCINKYISSSNSINPNPNPVSTQNDMDIPQWKDTIPFVPPITEGIVIKVYDGDTITIATTLFIENTRQDYKHQHQADDNNHKNISTLTSTSTSQIMYRIPVRLLGIDSPEIKGKTQHEKDMAKQSQLALEKLILHKQVYLKNVTTEKYGRLLADVYLDDLHINQWLLDNGYAVKYNGGKKTNWK